MTSIKIFVNTDKQNLERDVNKFLESYENYITTVALSIFINNQYPNYLALVTILDKKPTVNIESK
jgi:hypothetical protein